MKPQIAAFLDKSREFLEKAQTLLDAHHWPDEAGRAAYLAGLHAAQAFIFESTGKVIRRHSGVQREFARLAKDEPRLAARAGSSTEALMRFRKLGLRDFPESVTVMARSDPRAVARGETGLEHQPAYQLSQ